MGLFNFHSRYQDDLAISPGTKDGKIYRLVQLIAISVILAAATLLIFEVSQLLKLGSTANGMIFSLGVIGLGGLFALPWVRVFESIQEKSFKITGIVFLALIGVCVILWIVCVWQIISIVKNIGSDEVMDKLVRSLNVIRVSIIVSIQIVIASNIVMNVIKYRKTLLPYQILSGVSKLYIDFYLTLVFTAVTITTDGLKFSPTATILTNKWLLPLLVVFIMFTIFPNAVFRRADRRRLLAAKKEDIKEIFTNNQPQASNVSSNTSTANNLDGDSVEKKLQKIKTLLDNGLITQEEYDAKRAEIISNI